MAKKNRRVGYWRYYHLAHSREFQRDLEAVISLVEEAGEPWPKPRRGRPPVHSSLRMAFICLLMAALDPSYRDMESLLPFLKLPWNKPTPDHSTIHEAMERMPQRYLERILQRASGLCIAEAEWSKGLLAADSTGIETYRYEKAVIACKSSRRRIHLKYHVLAILDYDIILSARLTPKDIGDSPTFRMMLKHLPDMEDGILNGDKAYDVDENFKLAYKKGLHPNIKHRETHGRNRCRRFRKRAANEFDQAIYRYRGLVEGIFGAEESKNGLATRYRRKDTQRKWGTILAIKHNIEVLNRIECAKQLNVTLQPLLERISL